MCPYIFVHNTLCMAPLQALLVIPYNMLGQNLNIIGNCETHPLTWLPKLNYIALKLHCQKQWPKKLPKNIGPKNYIFKYPTTKILFVIKKLGIPRYQIISKIVLSIHNNNK